MARLEQRVSWRAEPGALSYVGFMCDDPTVQAVPPQVLVTNAWLVPRAVAERADRICLLSRRSSWLNAEPLAHHSPLGSLPATASGGQMFHLEHGCLPNAHSSQDTARRCSYGPPMFANTGADDAAVAAHPMFGAMCPSLLTPRERQALPRTPPEARGCTFLSAITLRSPRGDCQRTHSGQPPRRRGRHTHPLWSYSAT